MGRIEDLRAFVQIVEHGSIGRAADAAGIAKSAMSRRLNLLEQRMRTRLLTRSPHIWMLTEAGRQYYERGIRLLQTFDAFEDEVRSETDRLSGAIRVSAPLYFGKHSLTEPLLAFAEIHPGIKLHIDYTDRLVDVVAEDFDLVIRIADLEDSSLIARKLCDMQHVICASPEYLRSTTEIKHPDDLRQHLAIQFGNAIRPRWSFPVSKGKDINVPLKTVLSTQDGGLLLAAAERGMGVARMPGFVAEQSLAEGRLCKILTDFPSEPRGVYAIYPAIKYLPTRTRALIDFLVEQLSHP